MDESNQLARIFNQSYNNSHNTHYKFEARRKSMFSLPSFNIPNFDAYQLAFIEGKLGHPILNDLMVMFGFRNRLIIEVLVPLKEGPNEITNSAWTPDSKFLEHIIYPIENDALTRVVCSKYLLLDFRMIGRIKIENVQEIYKKGRLEWDNYLNDKSLAKSKANLRAEISNLGVPLEHWFKEIWLSYKDEGDGFRCIRIW